MRLSILVAAEKRCFDPHNNTCKNGVVETPLLRTAQVVALCWTAI